MAKKPKQPKNAAACDVPKYKDITSNRYVSRRPIVLAEDDIPVCNCSPETGCGDDCLNRLTLTECSEQCPCGSHCGNRSLQQCQTAKTKPQFMGKKGWGLVADEDIKEGQLVSEYTGEVLDVREAEKRAKTYQEEGLQHTYIMNLSTHEVIDATVYGSAARLINHGCEPNCRSCKWIVNGETRVGIYAVQDIPKGTELLYRYNLEWNGGKLIKCRCGAETCMGYLGADSQPYHKYGQARSLAVAEADNSETETEGSAEALSPGQWVLKENGKMVARRSKPKPSMKPRTPLTCRPSLGLPFPKSRPSNGTDMLDPLDSDEEGCAWRAAPTALQLQAREIREQLAMLKSPTQGSKKRKGGPNEVVDAEDSPDGAGAKRRRYQRSRRRLQQLSGIRERLLVQTATLRRSGLTVASGRVTKDTNGFLHQVGQHDALDSDTDMTGAALGVKLTRNHIDMPQDPYKPLTAPPAPKRTPVPRMSKIVITIAPPDGTPALNAGTAVATEAGQGQANMAMENVGNGVRENAQDWRQPDSALVGATGLAGSAVPTACNAAVRQVTSGGSAAPIILPGGLAGPLLLPLPNAAPAAEQDTAVPTLYLQTEDVSVPQSSAPPVPATASDAAAGMTVAMATATAAEHFNASLAVPVIPIAGGSSVGQEKPDPAIAVSDAQAEVQVVNEVQKLNEVQTANEVQTGTEVQTALEGMQDVEAITAVHTATVGQGVGVNNGMNQQPVQEPARTPPPADALPQVDADMAARNTVTVADKSIGHEAGHQVVQQTMQEVRADGAAQVPAQQYVQLAAQYAQQPVPQQQRTANVSTPAAATETAALQQQHAGLPYVWQQQVVQQATQVPLWVPQDMPASGEPTVEAASASWQATQLMPWQQQQQVYSWTDMVGVAAQPVANYPVPAQQQGAFQGYVGGMWGVPQQAVQPQAVASVQSEAWDWGKQLGLGEERQRVSSGQGNGTSNKYKAPWEMGS